MKRLAAIFLLIAPPAIAQQVPTDAQLDKIRAAFEICQEHRHFPDHPRGLRIPDGYEPGFERCKEVEKLWKEGTQKKADDAHRKRIEDALK